MKIEKLLKASSKAIALLASAFLMFNVVACSSDDDEDNAQINVKSISLSSETKTLEVGQTATLTVTVLPENATNKAIEWTSSDTAIATVENGVITAVAEGEATITATSKSNKSATATCAVTVANENTPAGDTVCWDFGSNDLWKAYSDEELATEISNKQIQGATGYITGSSSKKALYVNAASGKWASNSGANVQVGVDTEIRIPVSKGSVITLCLYPNKSYCGNWTFGGNEIVGAENLVTQLTASSKGYVSLVATDLNPYLQSITVTNLVESDTHDDEATTSDFKTVGDTTEKALFVQMTGNEAVTNASSGKLTVYIAGTPTVTGTEEDPEDSTKTVNVYSKVKWTVTGTSVKLVDSDGNEVTETKVAQGNKGFSSSVIVKFKSAGEAKITATIDELTTKEFTVTGSEVAVSAALSGEGVSGVKDTDLSGEATITVTNDVFSSAVQALEADADAASYITLTPSAETVTVSAIKVKTVSAGSITVSYTLSGTDAVAEGTLTATLKAGALDYKTEAVNATGSIALAITDGAVKVTEITFSSTTKKVVVGGTLNLASLMTVAPADATDKSVTWAVGTGTGAAVSDAGLVTVSATGDTTITATANDGSGKTATFTVTGVENTVQEYNFFAATTLTKGSSPSEVTSIGTDTTSVSKVTGFAYHQTNTQYGAQGKGTFVLPTTGADTTVIVYVTGLNNGAETDTVVLSDTDGFSESRTVSQRAKVNPIGTSMKASAAMPLVWRYTGTQTEVTVTTKSDNGTYYIGKIVTNNDPIPVSVTASSFNFQDTTRADNLQYSTTDTDGSTSFTTWTTGTIGTTKALYVLNASTVKNYSPLFKYDYGESNAKGWVGQAVSDCWFTFAVGGACTIKVTATDNGGQAVYLYSAAGEKLTETTGNTNISYTGEAGLVSLCINNMYFSTISISPAE